jgi:flagellar biosynthesis regulator FlaF
VLLSSIMDLHEHQKAFSETDDTPAYFIGDRQSGKTVALAAVAAKKLKNTNERIVAVVMDNKVFSELIENLYSGKLKVNLARSKVMSLSSQLTMFESKNVPQLRGYRAPTLLIDDVDVRDVDELAEYTQITSADVYMTGNFSMDVHDLFDVQWGLVHRRQYMENYIPHRWQEEVGKSITDDPPETLEWFGHKLSENIHQNKREVYCLRCGFSHEIEDEQMTPFQQQVASMYAAGHAINVPSCDPL